MPRNQRIGLLLAALVVIVVAIVIAVSGGDDNGSQATKTTNEQPHETIPAKPQVNRIQIRGGKVVGGPADIKVKKGDEVQIVVSADGALPVLDARRHARLHDARHLASVGIEHMTPPIAHAGHWITGIAYFLPVIAFLVWLGITQIRERRRKI